MENKEEKELLAKEAEKYATETYGNIFLGGSAIKALDGFMHGATWQKEQSQSDIIKLIEGEIAGYIEISPARQALTALLTKAKLK